MKFKEGDRVVAKRDGIKDEGIIVHLYDQVAIIDTGYGKIKTTLDTLTRVECIYISRDEFFDKATEVVNSYIEELNADNELSEDDYAIVGAISSTMVIMLESKFFGERTDNG